jgi:hypothetical protein
MRDNPLSLLSFSSKRESRVVSDDLQKTVLFGLKQKQFGALKMRHHYLNVSAAWKNKSYAQKRSALWTAMYHDKKMCIILHEQ